jgi:glycosyltransferase involved in cell wall biosynthesis
MLSGMRMPESVHLPRTAFGLPAHGFLFLFVFDMCSSFERKNPLAVIRAFRRAFRREEPVTLALKVSRGGTDPESLALLQAEAGRAGVIVIDRILPQDQLFGLMNACDCYVSLHRSEGFGLTLAEAMSLGKPVIATGYSGNLDFMTEHNSLLVKYRMAPLTSNHGAYVKGWLSAQPSEEHAAALMRKVYEHKTWAQALGERASLDVRALLSLEAAGQRMTARLDELLAARARGNARRAA